MTQHDYGLADNSGAAYRADLNGVLQAIVSNNMGLDAPSPTFPGMLWMGVVENSVGVLRVRNAQDGAWLVIGTGSQHLPLTGGVVNGNLAVAGVFSNPQFDLAKGSFASTTAPSPNLPGQLWYDLNTTPGTLKIKRSTAANDWVEVVDKTSPAFTDSVTIVSAATGNAQLNLTGAGERRRIVGEAAGNRWAFYGPNDALTAYISDAGDLYLAALGGQAVSTVLATKQPALGFTPVRQPDGNLIHIGSNPAHLWLNNVDQGQISVGADVPQFARGDVGVFSFMTPDADVPYNWQGAGSSLTFYPTTEGARGIGTWRNMDWTVSARTNGIFHRVA